MWTGLPRSFRRVIRIIWFVARDASNVAITAFPCSRSRPKRRAAIEALPVPIRVCVEEQAREVIKLETQDEPVACPLLIDNRCSIYESRPLICRTQGLPLLIEADDEEREVDFCPLNFTGAGAIDDLDEDYLVPLDALNVHLALVNLERYCENGLDDEAIGARAKMADIILK